MDFNDDYSELEEMQEMQDIRKPIPAYRDTLLPININDSTELEKAIQASLNDDIDYELYKAIHESIKDEDYEFTIAIQESLNNINDLNEINDNIQNTSDNIQNTSDNIQNTSDNIQNTSNELYNKYKIMSVEFNKVNEFIIHLKRINNLQENSTIKHIIHILEKYNNNDFINITVSKNEYDKIFEEIKKIRCNFNIIELLKSILNLVFI